MAASNASAALAAAISASQPTDSGMRTGKVTAITAVGTLTVVVAGASLKLPYLASYNPQIGDVVNILRTSNAWLVIGISAPGPDFCRVRQTVTQSLASGTATPVVFDTLDTFRSGNMWKSSAPTKIIIPRSTWYSIGGNVSYAANMIGIRTSATQVNGSPNLGGGVAHSITSVNSSERVPVAATIIFLTKGDQLELLAFQSSGGALGTAVSGSEQSTLSVFAIS